MQHAAQLAQQRLNSRGRRSSPCCRSQLQVAVRLPRPPLAPVLAAASMFPAVCCVCPPAVVDNLPQVPAEKYEKLTAILTKILSGSGRIREGGLFHPQDDAKLSKGCAARAVGWLVGVRLAGGAGCCRLRVAAGGCAGWARLPHATAAAM